MTVTVKRIVPAIRINNRKVNQDFLEQSLGMKTILEESAFAEFAGHEQKECQLVLVESPSARTRAVKGVKKLQRITIRVADPAEIETLLAHGAPFSHLYKGNRGYAFEAISPEGDAYLLHSEASVLELTEMEEANFTDRSDINGLSSFVVEDIAIRTPHPSASQAFYENLLGSNHCLSFSQAEGEDLIVPAEETWDLESLRLIVTEETDLEKVKNSLTSDCFMDKKGRFLQTSDPSHIDVWVEK
ncbi:CppA N-terminal domain-containing protein [Streptococcus cameli]